MKRHACPTPDVERRAAAIRAIIKDDPLYFTLLSNLTTLSHRCRFAVGADGALVARYLDLPFAAISFYGQGMDLRAALSELLAEGELCYVLVGEAQRTQLEVVTRVLDVYPEWQMVYRDDAATLEWGDAVLLGDADLPAMCALADRGKMLAFETNALEKGPYHGVWRDGRLVSMAGTHLKLERMAEIGNVVTDSGYRRQGLATMAVNATVMSLQAEGLLVILQVLKSNAGAIAFYETLGFERARTMYLIRFELEHSAIGYEL